MVRRHQPGAHFDYKLIQAIGCKLEGTQFCKHTGRPMFHVRVTDIPPRTDNEVKKFVQDGLFSVPCGFQCGNWIFWRYEDAPEGDANPKLHAAGWHKTGTRPKYFMCPSCNKGGAVKVEV